MTRNGSEKKKKRKHANTYASNRHHTTPAININSESVSYLILPMAQLIKCSIGLQFTLEDGIGGNGMFRCVSDWTEPDDVLES